MRNPKRFAFHHPNLVLWTIFSAIVLIITRFPATAPWAIITSTEGQIKHYTLRMLSTATILLALLSFAAGNVATLARDSNSSDTYFGYPVQTYLHRRTLSSTLLSSATFQALVALSFCLPIIIGWIPAHCAAITLSNSVEIRLLISAAWISAFTLAVAALVTYLGAELRLNLIRFRNPEKVREAIRRDEQNHFSTNRRRSMCKQSEYRDDDLMDTLALLSAVDSEIERSALLTVTIADRSRWSFLDDAITLFINTTRHEGVESAPLSALRRMLMHRRVPSPASVAQYVEDERAALLFGLLKTPLSEYVRTHILLAITQDAMMIDRMTCTLEAAHSAHPHPCLEAEIRRVHSTHSSSLENIFHGRSVDDHASQYSKSVLFRTFHSFAQISSHHGTPFFFTVHQLEKLFSISNQLPDCMRSRGAFEAAAGELLDAAIQATIIDRHPEESLPIDTLRKAVRWDHRNVLQELSQKTLPPLLSNFRHHMRAALLQHQGIAPDARIELLRCADTPTSLAAFLCTLLHDGSQIRKTTAADVRPFMVFFDRSRGHSIEPSISTSSDDTVKQLVRSSRFGHYISQSSISWLLSMLSRPLTYQTYLDMLELRRSSRLDLSFYHVILWRTVATGATYPGDIDLSGAPDEDLRCEGSEVRRAIDRSSSVLEELAMKEIAYRLRAHLPTD